MTTPRNILFLCHRLPYPPNKGDKIRSHALLKHLASKGTVHLGCFVDDRSDLPHLDAVRQLARGDCHFEFIGPLTRMVRGAQSVVEGKAITTGSFTSSRLEGFLKRLFRNKSFDDVVVFGSAMAPYLFDSEFGPHRVLFDMVDVDSDKWLQYSAYSTGLFKWLYHREAVTLVETERAAARLFGKTLLVSEFEADTFRKIAPESKNKIGSLTNGVDFNYFGAMEFDNPFSEGECPLVMTGHMGYQPNYEGALWFAKEILPLVQQSVSNVCAYFVGTSPPPMLRAVAGPSIVVTGSVADVRPYLRFAGAVVAPLRMARGLQNKVLEAMAMAKPVVATLEATRALKVNSGTQLWIANDPRHFANAVISALKGSDRDKISQAGRDYVIQNHNWKPILTTLDAELDVLRCDNGYGPRQQASLCPAE
jgi:sugar transferase (PEP-CTERM/EpsH1 system associated)